MYPIVSRLIGKSALVIVALMLSWANSIHAQTTTFTYQGRLTDGGAAANGSYDLQFTLWDAVNGGTQQPQPAPVTVTKSAVSVSGGIFTVQLDFSVNAFPGVDRFLEIGVRTAGGGSFTILSPRQQISSTPYAIRTLSAGTADSLSSACVACVQDAQINQVSGSKLNGSIPVASVPGGSGNYIQNTISQQAGSNFNVSGNGAIAGNVGIGTTTPQAKLHVHGTSWFTSDTTPLSAAAGSGVAIGFSPGINAGYIFGFDYAAVAPRNLVLNTPGGNVGIGTTAPSSKLEIAAQDGLAITGFQPFLTLRDSNASNKRSVIQGANGHIIFYTDSFINGNPPMVILSGSGNVGIGTSTPPHHLSISGGPPWTASGWTGAISMSNASAIGWFGNSALNRFGIGQTNGGLYFFHSGSDPGATNTPANYDMLIDDSGNIRHVDRSKSGLVKAMVHVNNLGQIIACYNGMTGSSSGDCGFSIDHFTNGGYTVDFKFQISDRFYSVIPHYLNFCLGCGNQNMGANFDVLNSTSLHIFTFQVDSSDTQDDDFIVIVY